MVRVLSCHAGYRCQRRGVCCTSSWPIPVEADRLARLRAALASGQLRTAARAERAAPFTTNDEAGPESPAMLGLDGPRCVFFDTSEPHQCLVHASLGHDALPLACRQFPRTSVHDPRGVSVTLSHYCPTAAALLEHDDGLHIISSAPAFPEDGEYVGLDATASLPPLLRPGMLMDWDAWWDVERRAVTWLANRPGHPVDRLAGLERVVGDVIHWSPADGPLIDRVGAAFDEAESRPASRTDVAGRQQAHVSAVWEAIPPDWRKLSPPPAVLVSEEVLGRFLATHAFANWTAHLGSGGLRTWLASIEAACALVESGLGVGTADLLLRHLADPRHLAGAFDAMG